MENVPVAFDWWRTGGRVIKVPACQQPSSQPPPTDDMPSTNHNVSWPMLPMPTPPRQHQPTARPQSAGPPPPQTPAQMKNPVELVLDNHLQVTVDFNMEHAIELANQEEEDCEISRDYWYKPDKLRKCSMKCMEGPRPAWCPAKVPTDCGVVRYPPPYTRYSRNRDKALCFVCKP